MEKIFNYVKNFEGGEVATYIPQLAEVDPNLFGVIIIILDFRCMYALWMDNSLVLVIMSIISAFKVHQNQYLIAWPLRNMVQKKCISM